MRGISITRKFCEASSPALTRLLSDGCFPYAARVFQALVGICALVSLSFAIFAGLGAREFIVARLGRLALLLGLLILPAIAVLGGAGLAVERSSSTEFCLQCHEMADHGRSLFVADQRSMPAVHYQNRLVDREHSCYQCHKNYAMFGDLTTKIDGLKHVWVHYIGPEPETLELYQPYPNANCLHCHDDGRSYLEATGHQGQFSLMQSNQKSCGACHKIGHARDAVERGEYWQAQ